MGTTVITVAKDDRGLIDLMIKSVCKYSQCIDEIIICNNGDAHGALKKYTGNPLVKIVAGRGKAANTSLQHGYGLAKIFPMVKSEMTAIVEPDCVVLKNDWDVLPSRYDMIAGIKGQDLSGLNYYYPCLMVFKTQVLWGVDFNATERYVGKGLKIRQEGDKMFYSDVGWQVSNRISNDRVKALNMVASSSENRKIIPQPFGHKTNEFWLDDEVYGLHFWRGSEPQRRKPNLIGNWDKQLGTWKTFVLGLLDV